MLLIEMYYDIQKLSYIKFLKVFLGDFFHRISSVKPIIKYMSFLSNFICQSSGRKREKEKEMRKNTKCSECDVCLMF